MIEALELPTWRGIELVAYRVTGDDKYLESPERFAIGDGWTLHGLTRGEVVKLAGIPEPFDMAYPQPWADAHRDELEEHGGWCVWQYSPLSFAFNGGPVFADELIRRARDTVASLIVEKLAWRDKCAKLAEGLPE